MKSTSFILLCTLFAALHSHGQNEPPAQQSGIRDVTAVKLLTQTLNVSGGDAAIVRPKDMTASGEINYRWGTQPVLGQITIKSRGIEQFRVDTSLSGGTRSWYVNRGSGMVKEANGLVRRIPFQDVASLAALTFPTLKAAKMLSEQRWSVRYVGLVKMAGKQLHDIHLEEPDTSSNHDDPAVGEFTAIDYFIDPITFQLVAIKDHIHPEKAAAINIDHIILFSDFRSVSGIQMPFNIVEQIDGQPTSTMQLNSIAFDAGLTDSDFSF